MERGAELLPLERAARTAEHLRAEIREPDSGVAIDHVHGAGVLERPRVLPGHRDREVVLVVRGGRRAIEIADHESLAEPVAGRREVGDTPGVLRPGLAGGEIESACGAVDSVHAAGIDRRAQILRRNPDRQIVVAVAVEVARGERLSEPVARFASFSGEAVLADQRVAGAVESVCGAVEQMHGALVEIAGAPGLARHADREIVVVVVVEVADGERVTELVARLRGAADPALSLHQGDPDRDVAAEPCVAAQDEDASAAVRGAADRHLGQSVAVEVAGRECAAQEALGGAVDRERTGGEKWAARVDEGGEEPVPERAGVRLTVEVETHRQIVLAVVVEVDRGQPEVGRLVGARVGAMGAGRALHGRLAEEAGGGSEREQGEAAADRDHRRAPLEGRTAKARARRHPPRRCRPPGERRRTPG